MKNKLILLLALCAFLSANIEMDPKFPPGASRNSLDWAGNYEGMIPAADCPGIEIVLTLNKNGTYCKTMMYVERQDMPSSTTGKFTWVDGSRIMLDEAGVTEQYFVAENKLTLLTIEGKKITGNLAKYYDLKKI